jgi:hypothetical protein
VARASTRSHRRHVVPRGGSGWVGSGWAVVKPGARRASSTHRTQAAAEKAAKRTVRRLGGEVTTHSRKGRIRDSDTIGRRDPHPPKDTRH